MHKKILFTIYIICIISLLTNFVHAQVIVTNTSPKVDKDRTANLEITFLDTDGYPVPNAKFDVFKIAEITEDADYFASELFDEFNLSFDITTQESWDALLNEILSIIDENGIEPQYEIYTDDSGRSVLENIPLGLYLVRGNITIVGARTYTPQSFIVSLPDMKEEDVWEYDVKVYPKYTLDIDTSKIVDKKVIKIWDDIGFEDKRPTDITVKLFKNGILYDEVILNSNNNFEYTWEDLDDTYEWSVEEVLSEEDSIKYSVNVEYSDNIFYITNTYSEFILPNTGQLWWPVFVLLGLGIVLITVSVIINICSRKIKKNEK